MKLTPEQCVERGVALLDGHLYGWERLINWETLDIWSVTNCIIGQLEHHCQLWNLLELLGFWGFGETRQYGFDAPLNMGDGYVKLNEAWRSWARSKNLF